MDNKSFDAQLKSTLENLEIPLEPTAWAAFEQRFPASAPPAADAVDEAVKRSLEQLETPYQPSHWDLLAKQLMRIEQLRRRIWISKSAEAAMLLLFLLLASAYGFFGFQARQHSAPASAAPKEPIASAGKGKMGKHATQNAADATDNANGFFVPLDPAQRAAAVAASGQNAAIVSAIATDPQEMMPNVTIASATNGLDNRSLMLPFGPLSTLDFLTLPIENLLNPLKEVTPKAPIAASHFYAATYAALDQNRVRIGSETRKSFGSGGGVSVGYRPGKWGVEVGVAINQKNYTPQKQVEIYAGNLNQGYYGTYVDQVGAVLLSVPVKATRRIARFGKTSVHATAGMTATVAMEKNYRYRNTYYPGSLPQGTPTANGQPTLNQDGKGVLEGGQYNDNAYATADLGLRIEHSIGKRLVAFVEPNCQFNVAGAGIGPKPAKINTVGFHAGVMASL